MSNSREIILQRVRGALTAAEEHRRAFANPTLPPAAEVWPRLGPGVEEMVARFTKELQDVHGEVVRVRTMTDAQAQLKAMADECGWATIGSVASPATRAAAAAMPHERMRWLTDEWTATQMAELSACLVPAVALLADTGSCVVACGTAVERLTCYIPPACVIIAGVEQLAEHLPAAWESLGAKLSATDARGEHVIITGPSRTADIEKILILGVHGPQRLIVLLVG